MKCGKIRFRRAFGVCITQTLVKIYNMSLSFSLSLFCVFYVSESDHFASLSFSLPFTEKLLHSQVLLLFQHMPAKNKLLLDLKSCACFPPKTIDTFIDELTFGTKNLPHLLNNVRYLLCVRLTAKPALTRASTIEISPRFKLFILKHIFLTLRPPPPCPSFCHAKLVQKLNQNEKNISGLN